MTRLHIKNVTKSFNHHPVLRGINLDVPAGSIVALLGPSGCGKTTLLRLIGGFDRLDDGEILFDARPVASSRLHVPPERRHIGYVPQEGTLFPHLSVTDNVAYGLSRSDRQGTRVGEVLALAGLSEFGDRYPHELSGGQQQRAALARSLAPEPEVILLDEPFNALDLDLRRQICDDVAAMLRREGATAILVTHDPAEAFAVADLVAVMHQGQIMQIDSPDNIYWQPANAHVARLTGQPIFLKGTMQQDAVSTPMGVLPVHSTYAAKEGKASIMLRPEQITFSYEKRGALAKVTDLSFRGNHVLLTVDVQDQTLHLRGSPLSSPALGEHVHLQVEGACAVFPE